MIKEMKETEDQVTKLINEKREQWCEKYIYPPDTRMSCFQVVELLEKLGLLKND
jgi:hypothetical protein